MDKKNSGTGTYTVSLLCWLYSETRSPVLHVFYTTCFTIYFLVGLDSSGNGHSSMLESQVANVRQNNRTEIVWANMDLNTTVKALFYLFHKFSEQKRLL